MWQWEFGKNFSWTENVLIGAEVLSFVVNNIAYTSRIKTKELYFVTFLETMSLYLLKMLQAVTSPGSFFLLVQYELEVTNWPYAECS